MVTVEEPPEPNSKRRLPALMSAGRPAFSALASDVARFPESAPDSEQTLVIESISQSLADRCAFGTIFRGCDES
jgi:hypothetical protein